MSCRLWLRPLAFARFTSLRDVSLRRNGPPARRAGAATVLRTITALMRGLRA
jgi:hypothetical protein